MFTHKITYVDFNGTERVEDFYFHLSLPEVTRLEAEIGKNLSEYAKEVAANQDLKQLLDFIEKLVLSSYGKKSPDGKSFLKSDDIRKEFEYSQAYAELFEEMLTSPELAKKFGESVADNGRAKKNQVTPTVVSSEE